MEIGYNAPWFFNQFKNGNYFVPLSVINPIKILKPDLIRVFGGTLGNYYDVEGPGYGFENTVPPPPVNYIYRYQDMMNYLPDVNTVFVANVYQALMQPLNTNYWIRNCIKALSLLPRVRYVELGNEINIDGKYMEVPDKPFWFWETASYVAKVRAKAMNYAITANKFYDAIKIVYPQIQIGIPMGNPFTLKNKEWNDVLRTNCKFDFEIFHIYATTKSYPETFNNIKKHFVGSIKPVAITEWGWLHGFSDSSILNQSDIGKDYYNQFFIDFPKACEELNVKFICRHQLYGDNVYSVIRK